MPGFEGMNSSRLYVLPPSPGALKVALGTVVHTLATAGTGPRPGLQDKCPGENRHCIFIFRCVGGSASLQLEG
jgi:hypothetical protein